MNNKKEGTLRGAFSFFELIIVILLIGFISYIFIKPTATNELQQVTNRLIIYLKQTRLQAFLQDFHSSSDLLWHKNRWTLKFLRCRSSVGGLYYTIYSDSNQTGHPSRNESLKDPLTQKSIYSSNYCEKNEFNSAYVLLTQEYNIQDVQVSCNTTSSLGQLSFGADGRVYSQLSNNNEEFYEYEIKAPCIIKIIHKNGSFKEVIVENRTGYIYQK